jgi:hypothetical protein
MKKLDFFNQQRSDQKEQQLMKKIDDAALLNSKKTVPPAEVVLFYILECKQNLFIADGTKAKTKTIKIGMCLVLEIKYLLSC